MTGSLRGTNSTSLIALRTVMTFMQGGGDPWKKNEQESNLTREKKASFSPLVRLHYYLTAGRQKIKDRPSETTTMGGEGRKGGESPPSPTGHSSSPFLYPEKKLLFVAWGSLYTRDERRGGKGGEGGGGGREGGGGGGGGFSFPLPPPHPFILPHSLMMPPLLLLLLLSLNINRAEISTGLFNPP